MNTSTQVYNKPINFFKASRSLIPNSHNNYYGKGLSDPAKITNSKWSIEENELKIRQSVFIILTTRIGTRLFRPDFGSMIPYLLSSPMSDIQFEKEMLFYSKQALERWETRIQDVNAIPDYSLEAENVFNLTVSYVIKGLGSNSSVQIPFNLESPREFVNSSLHIVKGRNVFPRKY